MPKCCKPSTKAASAASRHRLQNHAEQAAGAGEIALPQGMAGIAFQGGIEACAATSGRASSQRASVSAGFLMARQPHRQGAQAPQPRKQSSPLAYRPRSPWVCVQPRGMALVGGDIAQHHIGMAADIFGGRLDREIHAMLRAAGRTAASPRYCPSAPTAPCACAAVGDGGNVLHLEGQRAGAFAEHRLGVGLEQVRDAVADRRT